jgi:enolase
MVSRALGERQRSVRAARCAPVMIAPLGAPSFGEAVRAGAEVYAALTQRLGGRVQPVGDDIFVTNPAIIAEAISRGVATFANCA